VPQPDLALALEQDDLTATCDAIASVQLPDGSIPWYHGGRMDPWNHVEAAMALDVGGLHQESERAYAWLMRNQRPDGSWHAYYRGGEVIDSTLDSNVTAYLATGVWLNYLVTHDRRFLEGFAATRTVELSLMGAIERATDLERRGDDEL